MELNVALAFLLTIGAGLATGIGSVLAFFTKHTNKKLLSFSLGLSAGVMIYVAFVELLFSAIETLGKQFSEQSAQLYATLAFFGGIVLAALIDKMVPSAENPHEIRGVECMEGMDTEDCAQVESASEKNLARIGIFTALTLAIHNFPEGIATFVATLQDTQVGVAIAIAVAIHNIPEGIAVAIPIYFATRNKKKAFWLSFSSGLAEPLGALVAYFVLMPYLSPLLMAVLFAAVAGIMVYISFDELLPAAREYGQHHISIYGLLIGMAVMAATLIMTA
ncbi:MAG: zinc transporter ZupT [Rikenellaceae bacterium]